MRTLSETIALIKNVINWNRKGRKGETPHLPNFETTHLTAICKPPDWHFTPEGLQHNKEQGRDFTHSILEITFQYGVEVGYTERTQEIKELKSLIELLRMKLSIQNQTVTSTEVLP